METCNQRCEGDTVSQNLWFKFYLCVLHSQFEIINLEKEDFLNLSAVMVFSCFLHCATESQELKKGDDLFGPIPSVLGY